MSEFFQTIITAAGTSAPWSFGGYVGPKNLTPIDGIPLLGRAAASYSSPGGQTVIAVPANEYDGYGPQHLALGREHGAKILPVNPHVKGALVTALISAHLMDPDAPLVIAPGDSFIDGGSQRHVEELLARNLDSGTITFNSRGDRWSYVALNRDGLVTQVAEKRVIGQNATTGVFVFRSAEIFIDAAEWCLLNKIQTNDTFYVSSTLNYIVSQGGRVGVARIEREAFSYYSRQDDIWRDESNGSL